MSWKAGETLIVYNYPNSSLESLTVGEVIKLSEDSVFFKCLFSFSAEGEPRKWKTGETLYTYTSEAKRPSRLPSKQQRAIVQIILDEKQ